jgi:hypothetical protein
MLGSEDTHLRAVLPVSISQVKGLREKPRCIQLFACRYDMLRWGKNSYRDLALSWLRKELYRAKVEGLRPLVSYEFLRKAIIELYEFCAGPEAIQSNREAR